MNSPDLDVLKRANDWLNAGYKAYLFTVIKTWGSAPRGPGSILVVRDDGHYIGSVSGGCIEDDLAEKAKSMTLPNSPEVLRYGITADEAQQFGLPCGGELAIFCEPLTVRSELTQIIDGIESQQLLCRSVHMKTGELLIEDALPGSEPKVDGDWFHSYFGPKMRLIIIGANQLGSVLANIASTLDYEVIVCDPRDDVAKEWHVQGSQLLQMMPDDAIVKLKPDSNTAIVAVTHDPKLDDMALLEALTSNALYVGALGSKKNQAKRRERMRMFDLSESEISRLKGPVGISIGSRTPAEIAVSILAEIIQTRSKQRELANTPMNLSYAEVNRYNLA
ncbi:XdhC family protein [Methylophaga pinxianii]|uniref:XdhC family protein n=1 Tax=Methylophaga pinxianii TaxID=2881052 RepID=UPI001CF20265|nr:XdhC family protein [Methylophaga pinxianii]MCB2426451.1 XdhC family protein [Methylophaga pinxianii]UPH45021.1 XdhC family protein [Methylophaga pinxianii]